MSGRILQRTHLKWRAFPSGRVQTPTMLLPRSLSSSVFSHCHQLFQRHRSTLACALIVPSHYRQDVAPGPTDTGPSTNRPFSLRERRPHATFVQPQAPPSRSFVPFRRRRAAPLVLLCHQSDHFTPARAEIVRETVPLGGRTQAHVARHMPSATLPFPRCAVSIRRHVHVTRIYLHRGAKRRVI
jgi:hypothetical protein